ncbi:OR2B6 protein, partial [Polypterus senegalus]|nr:OR2B6 protein [Polypterus senegalus]
IHTGRKAAQAMYALICTLAVLDITFSSVTVPRIVAVLMFDNRVISFVACFAQFFLFHSLGSSHSFLLMLMAYERFVAICNPILYPAIMTKRVLLKLIALCCLGGFIALIILLSFYYQHCALTIGLWIMFISLAYILYSYIRIITSVLRIASSEGRAKAFSTCGTHLIVIFIFYFIAVGVYISYRIPGTSEDVRIITAALQTIIPPLLNPVVYCLRNKEIRDSFVKIVKRCKITPVILRCIGI